MYILLVICFVI